MRNPYEWYCRRPRARTLSSSTACACCSTRKPAALRSAVSVEAVTGERQAIDSLGANRLIQKAARNVTVPVTETARFRRWMEQKDYWNSERFDGFDALRTHTDPLGPTWRRRGPVGPRGSGTAARLMPPWARPRWISTAKPPSTCPPARSSPTAARGYDAAKAQAGGEDAAPGEPRSRRSRFRCLSPVSRKTSCSTPRIVTSSDYNRETPAG